MKTTGRHLLVEYHGCDPTILNDRPGLETLLSEAAHAASATVVQTVFHNFCPQGVSGVVVIEESHLSIHTWPETGYAAIDFYTCGECNPKLSHEVLRRGLKPGSWEMMEVARGLPSRSGPGLQVQAHFREQARQSRRRRPAAAPSSQLSHGR